MKKIFYYPFLILFFALVFFSFGNKVLAETCEGLEINAGEGTNRCTQASQELRAYLGCLYTKDRNIVITSIGDDPGVFSACVTNWNDPQCSHHANSCHYGGKALDDGTRKCAGSHAVDLRSKNLSTEQKNILLQQARSCSNANAFLELEGQPQEHIHASVGSATCDCGEAGNQSNSVWQTMKLQSQDVCIDFNVPIPGIQEFLTEKCPYDATKYLVNSKTVGLYINAVYKYGAGFAGVIAIFMIVFAAWQWIIAAGNSGKIENAKDTIISALIGLALLFGGYLLLSQISSRLVDLGDLDVGHIDPKFLGIQECQQIEASCGRVTTISSGIECLGQSCSSGNSCMEWGLGFTGKKCPILKDDLGLETYTCGCQLPADELNCDIVNAMAPGCYKYNNPSTCDNNFCNVNEGPCIWSVSANSCKQLDDASCNNDNDCGVVKNINGDMVDTCCDVDDYVNNCEFPVDYRLAHPAQFSSTPSPQADNCGD